MTAWTGFKPGRWQRHIDTRDFIQQQLPSLRGRRILPHRPDRPDKDTVGEGLRHLQRGAGQAGSAEVDTQIPAGILSHKPGYIDKDLRADRRPADRRALQAGDHARRRLAHGRGQPEGLRLRGRPQWSRSSPSTARPTTRACSTPTPPEMRAARSHAHHHRPAGRLRPRPHHRRLPPGGALRRGPADRGKQREKTALDAAVHRGYHP